MKTVIVAGVGAALLISVAVHAQSVRILAPDKGSKALDSYFPRAKVHKVKSVRLKGLAYNEKSTRTTAGITSDGDIVYRHSYSAEIAIPAPSKRASYSYALLVACSDRPLDLGLITIPRYCGLPPEHVLIVVTLKRRKQGEFDVLLPSESRLGGKIEVSAFNVIEVRRVETARK